MAFAFSDRHIDEYRTQGYTVFRQVLPLSLIADLRRVCDEARDLARQQRGSQAQRLQPIADFPLDQQPFVDYATLPVLIDAIHRLLSPDFRLGGPPVMGVLFEPAEWPWCTHWHRDWRDNMPGLELARWDDHFADDRYFNQVNCALYADSCTWVVPGSHLRRDLPCEAARFPGRPIAARPRRTVRCRARVRLPRIRSEHARRPAALPRRRRLLPLPQHAVAPW